MNMNNNCFQTMVLKQVRWFLFVMLVVFFLLTTPAIAGDITLTIESTTHVTGRNIDVRFLITNNGTESAVDVALTARLIDQNRKAWIANSIPPGKTETAAVDFQLPGDVEGTFPIFVKVSYLSLENMPYSSAVLAVARTSKALVSNLAVYLKHRIENGEHLVQVELRDASSRLEESLLMCHVPDDLAVLPKRKSVKFQGNKAGALFHIENLKGLPGSKYGVFVAAEYEYNKIHYLAYSSIVIPIEADKHQQDSDDIFLSSWSWFLFVIPVLVLCSILAAFSRTRKMIGRIFKKKK